MPRLGIYLDLRNPPGSGRLTSHVWGFALELCEEAERLGIQSVWVTEHHLFDDGYLTQPLVFAAAIAARTRTLRIGTAVVVAPFRSAPLIAEEAIAVDLLSDGRLELGLGSGYRIPEFDLFGADIKRRFDSTDRVALAVRELLDNNGLKPTSVQVPLPIWLGYGGPRGAERAGRMGFPLLSANRELAPAYLKGRADAGHDPEGARMAGHLGLFISEDPDRDWDLVRDDFGYQGDSYYRHMIEGTGRAPARRVDPDRRRERGVGAALGNLLVETPDAAAGALRAYTKGTPIDTVFSYPIVGRMSEERSRRHLAAMARTNRLLTDSA